MIGGVPWKTSEDDEGDGVSRDGVIKLDPKVMEKEAEEEIRGARTYLGLLAISKNDLVEHGLLKVVLDALLY